MRDNRIALENGYEIEETAGRKIKINSEVGRGASCIVYDAVYKDSIGIMHNIRVKECYPAYLLMERTSYGGLVPLHANEEKFNLAKKRFIQAYKRNVDISNTLGLTNSTSNSADIIQYNNTCYIMISLNEGSDYNTYEDESLMELFIHIKSLAECIRKYHEEEYLHLDIKPENVFILPETEEHILLFDFDSVTTKEELAENGRFGLSFSEGFSPPEQVRGNISKIGNHTDIFSIGALLYYKLFGRKPNLDECRISGMYKFNEMKFFSEEYPPKLYKVLENFLKKTLSVSIIPRWNHMQPLIDCLDELIRLSDVNGSYLIDSFQYNSAHFIGRESELNEIHGILENNQLVFLSGIGGIGKTELVKQYANRHRNLYDTIVFSVFDNDIESLVNNEIMINHVEKDEAESDLAYFERKIEILKHIVTDKDLIIIDNFDVDSDDKLELLFGCPCKFIVTSRMDFRDYNYEQIYVDRMENIEDVLELFYTYNDEAYNEEDTAAVEKLVEYVDYHTMTVELIAKYLRVSGEAPVTLLERFMEKEGTANMEEIAVRQRKDRRLSSKTVNAHLGTLFDISGFEETDKELIGSLSLFAGIRMKKGKFEEICQIDNISEKLDKLVRRGWIEYNEKTGKISLHQVIQDLVYKNLHPCAENCPAIVEGMIRYITAETANYSESRIKRRVFDVFMGRITGANIPYARLCMLYGKKDKLEEAEQICLRQEGKEAESVLQEIYREQIIVILRTIELKSETDNYVVSQLKLIEELLNKIIMYFQKYTDDLDHNIKEYVDIGSTIDCNLSLKFFSFNGRNPDVDRIYYKIIDMYNTVTELLPESSIQLKEKIKYYREIAKFYSDDDIGYRVDYFSNIEKAFWYQERIDELREETNGECASVTITDERGTSYYYSRDVSYRSLACKYRENGEYEKAIECYKMAYEDRDLFPLDGGVVVTYDGFMWDLAQVYLEMGEPEKAIECLEKALDCDKENGKNPDAYTAYVCIDLIKLLLKYQNYEKARAYALELIHYKKPKISDEDNFSAITDILTAYYYLYYLESEPEKKELLWQKCMKYYKMLKDNKIDKDVFLFIEEYLTKENVCFDEILEILDRIDDWHTKDIKERIILNTIEKNVNAAEFDKYHVIFMIKYAQLYNQHPYEFIKEAESNCDKAQELYLKYGLDDEYVQSLIFDTKASIMSNDNDYDQSLEVRKKCNYKILAEHQLKRAVDDKKRIKIWEDAASAYGGVSNDGMQVYCLEKSLEILVSVLNLHEFSMFGDYQMMMQDLIRAHITLKDFEKAKQDIVELYKYTIEYYPNNIDFNQATDFEYRMKLIADFYIEISLIEKAVNIYLITMYIRLEKDINKFNKLKTDVSHIDLCRLSREISSLLDGEIDPDIVDDLIDLKDNLVSYRAYYQGDINIYDEIISKISDRYQNQVIEFKE